MGLKVCYNQHMRKPRLPRTCETCGTDFEIEQWRLRDGPNAGRFCSRACKKTSVKRICEVCTKEFEVQPWRLKRNPNEGRHCSLDCFGFTCRGKPAWNKGVPWPDEMRAKLSLAHVADAERRRGIPLSPETRAKMSAFWSGRKRNDAFRLGAQRGAVKRHEAGVYPNRIGRMEHVMRDILDNLGVEYIHQKGIDGRFVVDFMLPPHNLIIEVDGDYWHANPAFYPPETLSTTQQNKVARDRTMEAVAAGMELRVLRFWDSDLKADPEGCAERVRQALH